MQARLRLDRLRQLVEELVAVVTSRARIARQVVELVDRRVKRTVVLLCVRLDEVPDGEVHEPGGRFAR